MNQNKQLVHLYQIWPSKNRFFCGGKIMSGPDSDKLKNTLTWAAIIIIAMPFLCYISPRIWIQLNPALPICSYILYIFLILFLVLTQFSDPGIIPRKEMIQKLIQSAGNEQLNRFIPSEEELNSYSSEIRICVTCQIKKPIRSHHCHECGNCVEIFDHHCPYVNNCIGKRNYAYFISFIFTLSIQCLLFGTQLLLYVIMIIAYNDEVQKILLVILMIPFGIALICIMCLLFFHLFLILKGRTTKEQLKSIPIEEQQQQSKCSRTQSLFNPFYLTELLEGDIIRHDPSIQSPRFMIVPLEEIEVNVVQKK